jgi:hypothetical protein
LPPQTNSDRINDRVQKVAILGTKLDERSAQSAKDHEHLREELASTRIELRQAVDRIVAVEARNAVLEERCQALQKLSDRGWQIWLALIGAGLALLVAFLKK